MRSRLWLTAVLALIYAALFADPAIPKPEPQRLVVQAAHTDTIKDIAFSADGSLALTASYDKTLKLWNVESGLLVRSFEDSPASLRACAISPDGARIASGSGDGSLRLWDAVTGELLRVWSDNKYEVAGIAFSVDGLRLISGQGKQARILDVVGGALIASVSLGEEYAVSIAVSPDGKTLAVGTAKGKIVLLDLEKAAVKAELAASAREVTALAFSPDAAIIAAALEPVSGYARMVTLWDIKKLKQTKSFAAHERAVVAIAFSKDAKTIYTAAETAAEGFVSWDSASGAKKAIRAWGGGIAGPSAFSAAIDPAGGRVAATLGDGSVGLWDLQTGLYLRGIRGHSEGIIAAAAADGRSLIAADYYSRLVSVWDLPAGRKVGSFDLGSTVGDLAYSACGLAAAASRGGSIAIWNPRDGKEVARFSAKGFENPRIDLSPDGSLLLIASPGIGFRLYDARTGAKLWEFPWGEAIDAQRISPDGKAAASCTFVRGIQLWDLKSGKIVSNLSGTAGNPVDVCFSPDGRLLAGAYDDGRIRLWDIAAAKVVATGDTRSDSAKRVAFRPDGGTLLSADATGRIAEWPLDLQAPLRALEDDSGRVNAISWLGPNTILSVSSNEGLAKIRFLDGSAWTALKGHPNGRDWLVFNREGFWDASSRGGEALGVAIGMKVYAIDQFAAASNRPDKVMRPFFADPEREAYFESRYRLRLSRLGLVEAGDGAGRSALALPVSRIASMGVSDGAAALDLDFKAGAGELRSYSVFVNGVPLFGPGGKPVGGATARAKERIVLSAGDNEIEVSCLDSQGRESPRARAGAAGPKGPKPSLYFLGFGVSKYKNKAGGRSIDLRYAAKDALDLGDFFKKNPGKKFDKVVARVFTDKEATRESLAAVREFLGRAGIDDTVILFVAGHGLYDDSDQYYFLSHEADLSNLAGSAIPFDQIEDLLQGIASRRKLLLMDTCASGLREGGPAQAAAAGSRGIAARIVPADLTRGLAVTATGKPRQWLFERDRFLFNDLTRRSGAIVFSSCTGDQVSWESEAFQNGLFTEYILKGLGGAADYDKDGSIDSDELRRFVAEGVLAETKGYPSLQLPVVDRDNLWLRLVLPGGK